MLICPVLIRALPSVLSSDATEPKRTLCATPHGTQQVLFVSIEQNSKLLVYVPAGGTLLRAFFEVAVPSLRLNSQESKILCLVNTFTGISRQQASKYLINPHLALRSSGVDVKGTRPYILSEPEPFSQAVLSFTPKELSRHDAAVRRSGEVNGAKVMANRASEIMQTAAALEQYVEENVDCVLIISSLTYHHQKLNYYSFLHISCHVPSSLQWNRYPKRNHSLAQIGQVFTRSISEWEGVRCHHSYPSVCFQRFVEFPPRSHQLCSHAFFLQYECLHSHARIDWKKTILCLC